MAQRFFVTSSGSYVGSFDGAAPPDGSVEVATAPVDGRQTWDFVTQSWGPVPATMPQPRPDELTAARAALDALVAAGVISAEARAQMSPGPIETA